MCVNKSASIFTIFFLRNGHKSLVRIYNNLIGINNSFHKIFVLCNLDLRFKSYSKFCEVPLNLFGLITKEPVWPVDQLLTISYSFLLERSPFCKAFLCCMIKGFKVRISIGIPLNNDGLIGLLGMLLHMAVIIGSDCRSGEQSQCSPGFSRCPWFLLRLPPHFKYMLTFFITMLLSGVLLCEKCNLNWQIVPAKLTLPK